MQSQKQPSTIDSPIVPLPHRYLTRGRGIDVLNNGELTMRYSNHSRRLFIVLAAACLLLVVNALTILLVN
jgi:hypothetical protein